MVFPRANSSSSNAVVSPATAGLLVILVVVIVGPSFTKSMPLLSPVANERDIEFKRYCSNSLSEIMFSICGGNFNSLFDRSRTRESETPTHTMKRLTPDADEELFYRQQSSGPVHECCRRPCGYTELKLYCASD